MPIACVRDPSSKMRWQHVVWLAAVLAAAGAQVVSIDDNLNKGVVNPPAPATNHPETLDTRETPVNYDNNEDDDDADKDGEETDDHNVIEGITPGSNETDSSEINGNGDQEDTSVENTEIVTEEYTQTNGSSNENGGEESVEIDQGNSNENPRSSEITASREITEVIETEGGPVKGYYLNGDSNILSYIDIPYGKFNKPFEAPTVPDPWETVHDVSVHQKRCPQIDESGNYAGDINCLTLSVFAPINVKNAPVLFHIYDGDFNTGSADHSIYGPEYLVTKGVILVLANYRLGALGFLCLNNDVAPGNAGLKDLRLALEWTWKNIALFGGNSSKITVSADGKSGALAGYLALSPTSRPFISGVITESGTMLAHWAIDRHPTTTASLLEIPIKQQLGDDINIETLVKAAEGIPFRPCVESGPGAFMNETPWEILHNEEQTLNIPFIIGSANHAGLQEAMVLSAESLSDLDKNFTNFLPDDLKFENGEEMEVAEDIKKLYFKSESISLEHIGQISLLHTDAYYLGPSIRASRALVAAGAKVYFYEFSFVGELNRMMESLSSTVRGAVRGDLACYTFMQDEEGPEEGSNEEDMVNLITDLWVSFLKTGVPSTNQITWTNLEKVEDKEERWLSIGEKVELSTGLHLDRLGLWTQIYDKHFIERNLAIELRSCLMLIVTGIFVLMFKTL